MSHAHVHPCPKCFRDAKCMDDCTREPPYYSRGVHLVCSECAGEIEHVDTDVMRSVIAELERWEQSASRASIAAGPKWRAVLASGGHLDGGARALDASEALREARAQGMREGADIALTYLVRGMSKGGALHNVNVAIEAVRKGER